MFSMPTDGKTMDDVDSPAEDLTPGGDVFIKRVEGLLDPAYRLATVIMLDYSAAADIVHDATLWAWTQYRRRGGDMTSFRTWFLAIVYNQGRRSRRRRRFALRGRRQGLARSATLHDALHRLSTDTRAALFCCYFLDLQPEEAAQVLGISVRQVRSRLVRAEERLQAHLEWDETPP